MKLCCGWNTGNNGSGDQRGREVTQLRFCPLGSYVPRYHHGVMGLALTSNSKLWEKSIPGDLAHPLRMCHDAFNHINGQTDALIPLTLLFKKKNYLFGCIRSQLGHVGSSLQCRFSSCDVPLACGILAPVERWGSPPLILLKTVIFFKNWKAWDLRNSKWFSGLHALRSILQTLGKQIVVKALKDFGPCISQDNASDSELLSAP